MLRNRNINGRIGNYNITLDPLLPIVVAILAWLLSSRYFPRFIYPEKDFVYWAMGISTSIGLTISILVHEFGHALVAEWLDIPIKKIHLFLFGGMAELKHRPIRAQQEMWVALAGPLFSLLFAAICVGLSEVGHLVSREIYYVIQTVAYMNLLLGLFNLVPIYPLDGGRALRAFIWRLEKNFYQSSRTVYKVGKHLIGIMFLTAIISYFFYSQYLTFWLGAFGLYMAYTILNASRELNIMPELEDMLIPVAPDSLPQQIITRLRELDGGYLAKSVIPVVGDYGLGYVLLGEEIRDEQLTEDSIKSYYRSVELGTYLDLDDQITYRPQLKYTAEYVPVLQHGKLLGISDAHEMRFWLLQQLTQ